MSGNVYDLGLIINNFGYTHYDRGEFEQARAYFEQAAALMENAGEWTAELNPRSNLAVIDAEAGHLTGAIDTLTRIIEILPQGKLLRERADRLDNLGIFQELAGDPRAGPRDVCRGGLGSRVLAGARRAGSAVHRAREESRGRGPRRGGSHGLGAVAR